MAKHESFLSWNWIRHHFLPVFLLFTTVTSLPLMSRYAVMPDHRFISEFRMATFLGNTTSWTFLCVLVTWAILFLKMPSQVFYGPTTSFGFTPKYKANGFLYYCCSVAAFAAVALWKPSICVAIYENMPIVLGNCATLALLFCIFLLFKGKYRPTAQEKLKPAPSIFEFYRGIELHPRIWEVDVKQLTNCRVGLMLWQILILTFLVASYQIRGLTSGILVNVLLQSVYLAKFYWWETGYFNTLDITMDRAGYYLCYGCLAFVPCFYTYSTYYFVSHPPVLSDRTNILLLVFGLISIYLNYSIDHQKEVFRQTNGSVNIWGKRPRVISTKYETSSGMKSGQLLVSGYWGIARHFNYVFELLLALFWNLPGLGLGFFNPFVYNYILLIILFHRIYRDEDKCRQKYGVDWEKYCQVVPYRLIPYVY